MRWGERGGWNAEGEATPDASDSSCEDDDQLRQATDLRPS